MHSLFKQIVERDLNLPKQQSNEALRALGLIATSGSWWRHFLRWRVQRYKQIFDRDRKVIDAI